MFLGGYNATGYFNVSASRDLMHQDLDSAFTEDFVGIKDIKNVSQLSQPTGAICCIAVSKYDTFRKSFGV